MKNKRTIVVGSQDLRDAGSDRVGNNRRASRRQVRVIAFRWRRSRGPRVYAGLIAINVFVRDGKREPVTSLCKLEFRTPEVNTRRLVPLDVPCPVPPRRGSLAGDPGGQTPGSLNFEFGYAECGKPITESQTDDYRQTVDLPNERPGHIDRIGIPVAVET
jgi:hypothetical protein